MRYIKSLIFFIILFSLTNCEKEAGILPKEYPTIQMKEATTSDKGVRFTAEITGLGNTPLIAHGFIWNTIKNPDFATSFTKSLDGENGLGDYSLQVTSDLTSGETFWVRPFVQNDKKIIYGDSLYFKSLGYELPLITDFTPKSGDSGDTIVISGMNFSILKSRLIVRLGDDAAEIISADFEKIKIRVPQKLSKTGDVAISIKSGANNIMSTGMFSINGHRITGFTPNEGIIGETVVEINGTGFGNNPDIIVRVGGIKSEILNVSDTKITIRLPYNMDAGIMYIGVEINGKIASSVNQFHVKSRWSKKNNFPGNVRSGGYFGVIGNFGYLICGNLTQGYAGNYVKEVWKYDFINDTWTKLTDFPGPERNLGVGFAINNEIYYGLGFSPSTIAKDFWKYNVQSNTWTKLKDFPGTKRYDVIFFTLKNKGYAISGDADSDGIREIWEYDPLTDTWTIIGYLPMSVASMMDGRDGFFQTPDKAYVLPVTFVGMGNKYFLYEFSPDYPGLFIPVCEYPLYYIHERFSCFAVNQGLYVGDDYSVFTTRPDFWEYNLSTLKWQRIESLPGAIRSYTYSFTYNGMGYVMLGQTGAYGVGPGLTEIWTYNPGPL